MAKIREALNYGYEALTDRLDAEVLLAHTLDIERGDVLLNKERPIDDTQMQLYKGFIARRKTAEPVAYIVGKKDFYDSTFIVSPDVLIPRPDSEILIDVTLELFRKVKGPVKILDLGVRSGCLLLSLLKAIPNSSGVGVDISLAALQIAKANAKHLNIFDKVELCESSWFENLSSHKVDLIISNPPYIDPAFELDSGVKDYEPLTALFANDHGLSNYRIIAQNAKHFLKEEGIIVLEIGYDQKFAVQDIFKNYRLISANKDLAGHDRCLVFSN